MTAPWLLVGFQAGALVDRCERRVLLLGMLSLRLGLLSILLVAAAFGLASLAVLYGAALILGLTETFTQSDVIALVPMIIPSARRDRANMFLVGAQQVIEVVAALLDGAVAQVFGVQAVFWIAAVLTLAMLPPFLLVVTEQAMGASVRASA